MIPETTRKLLFNCFAGTCFGVFFLLSATLFYAQNPPEQKSDAATTLENGKAVERVLTGEQKHLYQISLPADNCVKISVEQRGVDVALKLESPIGQPLEVDSDPRRSGVEILETAVKTTGIFTITVWTKQKNAAPGKYQIKIEEIRKATEKDFALDEARRLNWEAVRLWFVDKYDEALPLARRSVEIRERELGSDHPEVGTSLLTLANQYNEKGDYAAAEPLYLRALSIKEKSFGKDDISLAVILNNLGNLYQDAAEYVKAEEDYERALKIREKHLEPNHLSIANVLINLGNLSRAKGDWIKAGAHYQRVLEIREKALGPDHPEVATILNNLANLYSDNDPDITKSEPFYLRALQIREKAFQSDNPQIAQTVFNLAILYAKSGDLSRAQAFSRRALAIFEKSLGGEHPTTALALDLLATIYKNTGDYAQAESLYQRSIAIRRKTQGDFHPFLAGTYTNFAALYALKGDIEKSIAEQSRANSIIEFNTELNIITGSERQKIEYMRTLREGEDRTLTLGFQFAPESKTAAALSATMILQRKGRVLDAVSDSLNALRRRFSKQDQALLDDLNKTTGEIAAIVSGGAGDFSLDEKQTEIKTLTARRENLEVEISRRAGGFYERSNPISVAAVQSAIPAQSVLLEFSVYQPVSLSTVSGDSGRAPHYAVFILSAGELKWKDLGEAKKIDETVDALRQALRDPKRDDAPKFARALDEKIMQPVRALLGDARQILVSPDGELNLIPFETLVDEQGKYLIENFSFTYLTSGRDLLRMQTTRASKSKPLVIANPTFGESEGKSSVENIPKEKSDAPDFAKNGRRDVNGTRAMSDIYFAPLGGTAQEARSIQAIFPDATFLTGAQATESALRQADAPQLLHVATHGFFLENGGNSFGGKSRGAGGGKNIVENPLLRSGLALAGANRRGADGADDGILTALEASGLNLWGTKLVVLSACDTGVGEVKNGEGVYGLRRAFVLAGAESLVMSLWPVSDYATRELMSGYYKNLKQGLGRGAALRQIRLEILKRPGRRHPFYWAGFIQSGEWANLDGKR